MKLLDAHQRLVLVLTAVISTAGCAAPMIPPGFEREEVLEVGEPTEYLTCAPGAMASPASGNIGADGGELATAGHRLSIPASAVATQRLIILREAQGERVGVEIEQQRAESTGLARSATLWIDASRCSNAAINAREWFIWRINPTSGESQKLRTIRAGSRFMTHVDSFSGFIIAH